MDGNALEVVEWRSKRIRSTVDGLRLIVLLLILLALAGLGTVAPHTVEGANIDAGRAVDHLPPLIANSLETIGAFSALAALIAMIARGLIRQQPRIVVDGLLAGAICLGVVGLLVLAINQAKDSSLYNALTIEGPDGPTTPFDAFLAAWLAFVTVAEIGTDRLWRRIIGMAIAIYVISVFAAGLGTVLSLAMSTVIGVTVGVGLRYLFGRDNARADATTIAEELARRGLVLRRIEQIITDGPSRRYRGTDGTARSIEIVVLDRDQAADGWIYRTYRAVRLQTDITGGPNFSMERAAERRVLLATAARTTGARLPGYLASANCGPESIAIAYEYVEGTALGDLDPPPTREQIASLWESAGRLHQAGISHPLLDGERITVTAAGQVVLPIMSSGNALANELRITLDRAQLLVTSAQVVGAKTAVQIARAAVGDAELMRALGALQPIAMSRATRRQLKSDKDLLDDIRAEARGPDNVALPELYRVERFRPRTILMLVGLVVAGWLLVGQLGSVDLVTLVRTADWRWVPLLALASALTYPTAAVSLLGYVREHIPLWRTTVCQVAASFVGFVLPPAVGGVGVNVRFLQNRGLSLAAAGTSVATSQIGNALSHIVLLTIVVAATGTSSEGHSSIPGWIFLLVGGLTALVMIALSVPVTRRWILARILPSIREVGPRLLDLVSHPTRLAQAMGGAIVLNCFYAAALYFAVLAFHGDVSLLGAALVYLTGAAIGSAAPTPGGIGAVEAAMSAGLVSAGMPGSAAVSAVLLFRIATFWLPVPAGWVALHWLERKGDL